MSQSYFEKIFKNCNLDWKTIYFLPRIATVDVTIPVFQYKLLNNVLFLNKNKIDLEFCKICYAPFVV